MTQRFCFYTLVRSNSILNRMTISDYNTKPVCGDRAIILNNFPVAVQFFPNRTLIQMITYTNHTAVPENNIFKTFL